MSAETAFVEECDAAYVHHDVVLDEIPVLDSGPYFAGEAGAREKLAGELRHAQENIGFYYIINHAAPGGVAGDRPVLNGGFLQSGRGSGRRTARHLRRPRQSAALRARMLPRLPRALLRSQFFRCKRRARRLNRCCGVTGGIPHLLLAGIFGFLLVEEAVDAVAAVAAAHGQGDAPAFGIELGFQGFRIGRG
jgi:hypothetical protein